MLTAEVKDGKSDGSAFSKFKLELKKAYEGLSATFDTQLKDNSKGGESTLRSV